MGLSELLTRATKALEEREKSQAALDAALLDLHKFLVEAVRPVDESSPT